MSVTRYSFSQAANQPLELQHNSAVLAVTAFDFIESMVGAYQELVLAVIVPPMMKTGCAFPKSAFFPFLVGTSTEASRLHAIERWHLPHYMADIDMNFETSPEGVRVVAHEADQPILEMKIDAHEWSAVDQLFQCFTIDGDTCHKVDLRMEGRFTEHEEESGSLTLHAHAMTSGLDPDAVADYPFREMWMTDGQQIFDELESI
jgi:hypothetical protein